ncbi:SLC13 family permease [Cryomorphaceae bacterium 1068]|nr:SLC13 family permease [Cryomorphaceae bacterium 1068]
MKRIYKLALGPIVFLLLVFLVPLDYSQTKVIGVAGWMITWWITQVIPIGATAILPMVLFPALGVESLKSVTSNYANPIIYLFFGGFVLGLAIERWNLHQRFALVILKKSGNQPRMIIFGSMLATAVMSMWISNTASTMMMLPIGLSITQLLQDQFPSEKACNQFTLCLLLGLAYAANIGGIATLIGTPPNLVLAALAGETLGIEIGFTNWLIMALPITILLFFLAHFINTRILFRVQSNRLVGMRELLDQKIEKLGPQGSGEKRVQLVFLATALLWIFRTPLSKLPGMDFLSDPIIAVASAVSLFIIPSGERGPLLIWDDTRSLPWDILLLFGGGLSMASGLASSGLVELLGSVLSDSGAIPWFLVIAIIVLAAIFFTEGMSNVALVSILVPIAFAVAIPLGGDPMELAIPLTIAASCAFMLPIATPPNAIVFSSNCITMQEMMRAGFLLNILAAMIISAYAYFIVPLIF